MAVIHPVLFEDLLVREQELEESDIQSLREWCSKQSHSPNISDTDLAVFLHSNYYRLEPTKTTIENYYTLRTHLPEYFNNRDPFAVKELRQAFNTAAYMQLDGKTPEGYEIVYGRLIDFDPSHYTWNDTMKLWNMVTDLWIREKATMKGHLFVVDITGVTFGHAGRLSPLGFKKYLTFLQDALPVRLKGLHFIHSSPVMEVILAMMKPFMKKELLDILHIHTNNDTVAKFFPLDLLPNESGGKSGDVMTLHERNIKKLESNREWFLEDEQTMRVNEALRSGKQKTATDLFGVEGSFKKLNID
ncbi:alpha-tocopherol transfer protein [Fopius arisanus]|uniref:Alpha-tocopherol transfer protein n=2 Tax=Fopius arisanus TaxID=64838 RepID=A0A0C9RRB1_9HYME|nr:PREDICTED: alpha-tocopherol transfer protein-like [Fopius arisanus]